MKVPLVTSGRRDLQHCHRSLCNLSAKSKLVTTIGVSDRGRLLNLVLLLQMTRPPYALNAVEEACLRRLWTVVKLIAPLQRLSERYERGSVLLSSNLPFSKLGQIFKDPMTTAAAIDRLIHHSVIIELKIKSYRLDEAKSKSTQTSPGSELLIDAEHRVWCTRDSDGTSRTRTVSSEFQDIIRFSSTK